MKDFPRNLLSLLVIVTLITKIQSAPVEKKKTTVKPDENEIGDAASVSINLLVLGWENSLN